MTLVAPSLMVVLGALYTFLAVTDYKLWANNGPGPGLIPMIAGMIAIITGILVLLANLKLEKTKLDWHAFFPFLGAVGILASTYIVGLIVSMTIYIILWLTLREKYTLIKSTIISVACTTVIYLVFVTWLSVPFPTGILGLL